MYSPPKTPRMAPEVSRRSGSRINELRYLQQQPEALSNQYSVGRGARSFARFVVERQIRGSSVGCMLHVNACCRQASIMDFSELTPHTIQLSKLLTPKYYGFQEANTKKESKINVWHSGTAANEFLYFTYRPPALTLATVRFSLTASCSRRQCVSLSTQNAVSIKVDFSSGPAFEPDRALNSDLYLFRLQ
ncbi:hypothetical protein EVAR_14093_1 [Eumeta japonica]|uniref:Uncharacterized protein n=1 Tax=Eumeta variegata TaxID=151549 RepID=A0A4C1UN83_EUMVA|nr:hypothetical protein EVAR_14093_1 [Eumeta japonica]